MDKHYSGYGLWTCLLEENNAFLYGFYRNKYWLSSIYLGQCQITVMHEWTWYAVAKDDEGRSSTSLNEQRMASYEWKNGALKADPQVNVILRQLSLIQPALTRLIDNADADLSSTK